MLTVRIDRLRRWYAPGVLLIGDAAHAMSPIGGVGINLAVQDAVAAARILAGPLLGRRARHLGPGQGPVAPGLSHHRHPAAPAGSAALSWSRVSSPPEGLSPHRHRCGCCDVYRPTLQRVPARIIGVGLRPEHLQPYPK
ncbi:MAG: FAD-dependent monooxygenase [Nocardioidaceae bacterium]